LKRHRLDISWERLLHWLKASSWRQGIEGVTGLRWRAIRGVLSYQVSTGTVGSDRAQAVKQSPLSTEGRLRFLRKAAEVFGTRSYVYDCGRLQRRVTEVENALGGHARIRYSLKANPLLGLCERFAHWGLGADVASPGEFLIAKEAGFPSQEILVASPYMPPV